MSNSAFCIYGFSTILSVNSDYFLERRKQAHVCNGEELCSLWGTRRVLRCYLDVLRLRRIKRATDTVGILEKKNQFLLSYILSELWLIMFDLKSCLVAYLGGGGGAICSPKRTIPISELLSPSSVHNGTLTQDFSGVWPCSCNLHVETMLASSMLFCNN
jgi:hypothetical protein